MVVAYPKIIYYNANLPPTHSLNSVPLVITDNLVLTRELLTLSLALGYFRQFNVI